jgi:microcystin-dependent protein
LTGPTEGAIYTAPASVTFTATAADSDGTVKRVDFYENGNPVGSDTTSPYTFTWATSATGNHTLTAVATDNLDATTTSAPVNITVNGVQGRTNVALAANGATAVASSTYTTGFEASGAINGDRKGQPWGNGGGWADATPGAWPDWLEVDFAGAKTIDELDVFSVQDNYTAPVEPTSGMTFTRYGLTAFSAEYWNGTQWLAVPGGIVSGNTLVWRQVTFAPLTTTKIRVLITGTGDSWSRVTEVEAYQAGPAGTAPTVTLTKPLEGASYAAPASVVLEADASDSDGTVKRVDFYENGNLVGSDATTPFTFTWATSAVGNHTLTAVATDNLDVSTTSAPVHVTVTGTTGRVNVAAAANGATAIASSTYGAGFGASGAINGDRMGQPWGNNAGWTDGTGGAFPDWLEVDFAGAKTIDEVDVFSLQDNYTAPSEPTPAMTFSRYGLTVLTVQYWDGAQWLTVPGGIISGNTLVWCKVTFAALTTTKIRIFITATGDSWSRVTEVEAYSPQ